MAASIPHQGILINALGMQEAKDSSAIENVVTTHDELFRDDAFPEELGTLATKEALRYSRARFGRVRCCPHDQAAHEQPRGAGAGRAVAEQCGVKVSRLTATRYLDALIDGGFLLKRKVGRSNYYINLALYTNLTGESMGKRRRPSETHPQGH